MLQIIHSHVCCAPSRGRDPPRGLSPQSPSRPTRCSRPSRSFLCCLDCCQIAVAIRSYRRRRFGFSRRKPRYSTAFRRTGSYRRRPRFSRHTTRSYRRGVRGFQSRRSVFAGRSIGSQIRAVPHRLTRFYGPPARQVRSFWNDTALGASIKAIPSIASAIFKPTLRSVLANTGRHIARYALGAVGLPTALASNGFINRANPFRH